MTRLSRAVLLPAVACAVIAITVTAALGARGDRAARTTTVTEAEGVARKAVALPRELGVRGLPPVTLRTLPGDVIEVRGKLCPEDHPRPVGTSSSASSTQVDGGPVRRHARHRLLCAR
jgi:hypothetical protein